MLKYNVSKRPTQSILELPFIIFYPNLKNIYFQHKLTNWSVSLWYKIPARLKKKEQTLLPNEKICSDDK